MKGLKMWKGFMISLAVVVLIGAVFATLVGAEQTDPSRPCR